MKKEAIRGRVERHRGSDKLILSKRFIAFLQEIRKEACAAKKKPAKPTLEKKVSPASNQNPCLLASFVSILNLGLKVWISKSKNDNSCHMRDMPY